MNAEDLAFMDRMAAQEDEQKVQAQESLGGFAEALDKKVDTFDIINNLQKKNPIIYDSGKQYWAWSKNARMYIHVDEIDVLNTLKKVMRIRGGTIGNARATYLNAIKMTGRELEVKPVKLSWVAFKDCVVDIKTGKQFQQSSKHFFTNTIPFNYGESEDTPTIDALFETWVGKEHVRLLYEIAAYCLYNHYPIHRAFLLFGSGRNGKGQYINLLEKWIGSRNITSSQLELLVTSRFESAKLFQKKACFMGETNYGSMNKTNIFKMLIGDDNIGGEFKGGKHFDFHNYAKLIIASNSVPPSDDKTEGFGSKWVIVDFFNKFEKGKPIIDTIPDIEYDNLCRKCIKILIELLDNGIFTGEGDTTARAKRYEEKSNPLQKFIEENCEISDDLVIPLWDFCERYDVYQDENRLRKLSKGAVKKWFDIKEHGFETKKSRIGDDNWVRIYGIGMKDDSIEDAAEPTESPTLPDTPIGQAVSRCLNRISGDTNGYFTAKEVSLASNGRISESMAEETLRQDSAILGVFKVSMGWAKA